jgi:hypothetical protein
MITENDLIFYLEELINDIKNEKLTDGKKRELTMMCIKNKYKEETNEETNLKYLSLGWYIYNFLLNKNQ